MKIGVVSDSLANLPRAEMLDFCRKIGIQGVEFNAGNWSTAPHLELRQMISSAGAREEFREEVESYGLEIIALNCNGNQLHPVEGGAHTQCIHDTIKLSGLLGLETVVLMSGLPSANPDDSTPNWITASWPPENQAIVEWQWKERLLPWWRDLTDLAADHGVRRLAVEMHGGQLVYSPRTLMRLRNEIGPIVCANLDPSHLMWMGADAIAACEYLGSAITHVHGKDTFINQPVAAIATLLENGPLDTCVNRSWTHSTIGVGHDLKWWSDFCYRLRMIGYDGWISIEHEDSMMSRKEGLAKAVDMLRKSAPFEKSDYQVQDV
jgi:sugar phosphate isomerase/epimerase